MPGASQTILDCLQRFGLDWDGEIYYQSRHLDTYIKAISRLRKMDKVYPCTCSRKLLAEYPGVYPGFCRNRQTSVEDLPHALRLKTEDIAIGFTDRIQGQIHENMARQHGDFIIARKDGIIAYQLAVVVDDYAQKVNRIVRGFDLLDSTPKQIWLRQLLAFPDIDYMHVPVIVDAQGQKLSKQTYAQAIDASNPSRTLFRLLNLLQQNPPNTLHDAGIGDILDWAIAHWQPQKLEKTRTIRQSSA